MLIKRKKWIAGLLALCLCVNSGICLPPEANVAEAASNTPGIEANVTKNNILSILDKYDKDGAYILRKQIKAGDNILMWFPGGARIVDRIGTAVHEETHGYLFSYAKKKKQAYFIGNRKTVYITRTKVFRTKKIANSIPKSLRTFRYDMYIAKPSKNLAANIHGAYGLLNEFMAYRAGMNTAVSLCSYYIDKDADWDIWQVYIRECENGRLSYAEFKYYILHYLYYAKKHSPKVYKGIVQNKQFCMAYRKLESSYAKLIKTYEKDLERMRNVLTAKGYEVEIEEDTVWVGYDDYGAGAGRYTTEYQKLQNELSKSKYKSIHKRLTK